MNVTTNTATTCTELLAGRINDGSGIVSFDDKAIAGLCLDEIVRHEDEYLSSTEEVVGDVLDTKSAITNVKALCKRARDAMGEAYVLEQQGKEWRTRAAEAINLATLAEASYEIALSAEEMLDEIDWRVEDSSFKQFFVLTSIRKPIRSVLRKIKYLYRVPVEEAFSVVNSHLKPLADQITAKGQLYEDDVLDWGSILTSNNILVAGLLGGIAYGLVQIILSV